MNADGRILYNEEFDAEKAARLKVILGEGRLNYVSLIEQLLFMEETHK